MEQYNKGALKEIVDWYLKHMIIDFNIKLKQISDKKAKYRQMRVIEEAVKKEGVLAQNLGSLIVNASLTTDADVFGNYKKLSSALFMKIKQFGSRSIHNEELIQLFRFMAGLKVPDQTLLLQSVSNLLTIMKPTLFLFQKHPN